MPRPDPRRPVSGGRGNPKPQTKRVVEWAQRPQSHSPSSVSCHANPGLETRREPRVLRTEKTGQSTQNTKLWCTPGCQHGSLRRHRRHSIVTCPAGARKGTVRQRSARGSERVFDFPSPKRWSGPTLRTPAPEGVLDGRVHGVRDCSGVRTRGVSAEAGPRRQGRLHPPPVTPRRDAPAPVGPRALGHHQTSRPRVAVDEGRDPAAGRPGAGVGAVDGGRAPVVVEVAVRAPPPVPVNAHGPVVAGPSVGGLGPRVPVHPGAGPSARSGPCTHRPWREGRRESKGGHGERRAEDESSWVCGGGERQGDTGQPGWRTCLPGPGLPPPERRTGGRDPPDRAPSVPRREVVHPGAGGELGAR